MIEKIKTIKSQIRSLKKHGKFGVPTQALFRFDFSYKFCNCGKPHNAMMTKLLPIDSKGQPIMKVPYILEFDLGIGMFEYIVSKLK